jgi:2-haloacid dehalogenase
VGNDPLFIALHRRALLAVIAAGAATSSIGAAPKRRIRAIAFDAFVIFDGRTIVAAAREALGESGATFAAGWLQKLFGNTWLLTAAGRYLPFEQVAASSLASAAEAAGLVLPAAARSGLIENFSKLGVWPDVPAALEQLRAAGIRTALLTNLSETLLSSNLKHSGLAGSFDAVLSTDRVRSYKPAPAAYAMAPSFFGLPRSNIGFAAFGGWDAVGATWFGFPTAWVNRNGAAEEWLDATPSDQSRGIEGVLSLAGLV